MFNKPGIKIQSFAKVFFVLSLILTIFGTIVCILGAFISMEVTYSPMLFFIFIIGGIILFVVGFFASWISALCLFSFGRITESVEKQNELTEQLINIVSMPVDPQDVYFTPEPQPMPQQQVMPQQVPQQMPQQQPLQ